MNLKQYLHGLDIQEREKLAEACGSTLGHLRNVMYGYRPCSAELAAAIERHTERAVTRKDMRPDDWQRIWPELADSEEKQPMPSAERPSAAINPAYPAPALEG